MHGGVKFYRGSAAAARCYVEADRSRVDDYYLAEGTGLADHYVATGELNGERPTVSREGSMDGDAYERWVAGYDATGQPKGHLRKDARGLRFVEVVVNGPKTWSLAAAVHPELADAYDAAQDQAAREIITWLAENATTRVGPLGGQVQVPVERLDAAVVRHHTSRAGDPHRHLHLQINARVFAAGKWRGLHSVGVVDSIKALHGIGHAAVVCNPHFRQALADHGYTVDPETAEITQLAPYAGRFSARSAQIGRNIDRYEADWRSEHPGEEPGRKLRQIWDHRAWADARPDKVVPTNGAELTRRWVEQLSELGFTPPTAPAPARRPGIPAGRVDRDAAADLALSRLGVRRSAWNAADLRGEIELIVAGVDLVTAPGVRRELTEDITARAVSRCVPLLDRADVPAHIRALTSRRVLDVESDLVDRLARRAEQRPGRGGHVYATAETTDRLGQLDSDQRRAVKALLTTRGLLVVEGAAGAGKTSTLTVTRLLLESQQRRLIVVTPTRKAAQVAQDQIGAPAFSAAWLAHQHGFRWDEDGHRDRVPARPSYEASLLPGDLLLVDEAGMLDQDTAQALLTIADESGASLAVVGDRHQLPAVGRGGVLDHAARWARPESCLTLETTHRFIDPAYAEASLLMRTGRFAGSVFDTLHAQGLIALHATDVERRAALTHAGLAGDTVIADTREQVGELNDAIRDLRQASTSSGEGSSLAVITSAGTTVTRGDQVATRRNNRALGVANRDRWVVTGIDRDQNLLIHGRRGDRTLPPSYVARHVELAYATTVHGAQGETVNRAHLLVGESTGAAAAYVGMTRGRHSNTAHLVAETLDEARQQWIEVFSRDRADLGPAQAANTAAENIERYGPQVRPPSVRFASHDASPPVDPRRPVRPPPLLDGDRVGRSPGLSR